MKTNPAMKLSSSRVYLKVPVRDDFAELAARYRSSRKHFAGYASSTLTAEKFESMLADSGGDATRSFLICRMEDDTIVGTITLSQIFRKLFQNAYIGYQLFAGYTGEGYMTEAVAVSLRFAFVDLRLHRVEASVQPGNKASIAVLRRSGFVKEGLAKRYLKINGRWRDHERWAILKEDWVKLRKDGFNHGRRSKS